jgi:hypothetical protein
VPIAGGMGNRAGEAELDPVTQYLNDTKQGAGGKMTSEDLDRLMSMRPKPEMGSGNGIVMV